MQLPVQRLFDLADGVADVAVAESVHQVVMGNYDRAAATMSNGLAPEYVAVDLKDALRALGQVLGAVDVEQILDSVFSQFCIGK